VVAGATALVAEGVFSLLSPACAWQESVEAARTAARRIGRPIDMRLSRLLRDILGDPFRRVTLEDVGCADPAILGHCRSPGPHVRGCWVIDLLLGKD